MKDEFDEVTFDAFEKITAPVSQKFAEMVAENYRARLIDRVRQGFASHYQAMPPFTGNTITGRRWAGSTTPDDVKDLWQTPKWLFGHISSLIGGFDIDAAASAENTLCPTFYSEQDDALSFDWEAGKKYWLNCPYSEPGVWVTKAIAEYRQRRNTVVMLLPADTSTKWFAEALAEAAELIFLVSDGKRSGRVPFVNAITGKEKNGNNKGSMIFIFRAHKADLKVSFINRTECENSADYF